MAAAVGLAADLPEELRELGRVHRERTAAVTPHYIGVNHALRSLDAAGRAAEVHTGSRDHLRLTVHAKAGEPRPALHQSGSRARPALLPMHSVGLRYVEKGRPRIAGIFELEARIYAYRPVMAHDGSRVLYFEPTRKDF